MVTAAALIAAGCAAKSKNQAPGVPPSPASVTREEPGGDALDPREAALDRLANEPWGWRSDKQDAFHFPLTDWENWRRVRYWGLPTFVAFRYGDAHHGVTGLWVRALRPEDPDDINVCFDRMHDWGKRIATAYQTSFTLGTRATASWKAKDDVIVQTVDAGVFMLLTRRTYRAVVGVTFGWPRVCLVYGYAFRDDGDNSTAVQVRDRYAREAFQRLTVGDPLRPPAGVEELPLPLRGAGGE